MKKGILLVIGLMIFTSVTAKNITTPIKKIGVHYRYNNEVTFVERNIQFHVFLNGDFDFNTNYSTSIYYDYNGRRTKKHRGIRIERDYNGRIRRVGNTFINYDYRGNVKRIGSVFIDYRFGQLTRVGHLKIKYDRWGNPRFYGHVKRYDYYDDDYGFDFNIQFGHVWDYNDDYFYRGDFRHNYKKYKEDSNYYYYRAKPNAKIGKRGKLLRRRKATSTPNKEYRKSYKKRNSHRKEYKKRSDIKDDKHDSKKYRKRRG